MDPLSHPAIVDEVALLSSGFANNVNVSELAGDHGDQQPPRLGASGSSPIEASPRSGRVPPVAPATSSSSNAPIALAPNGVTSSLQFAIPSQPPVSLETLATPRTSSEDTPRAPTSVAEHVEDDGPGRDSSLDTLQRPGCPMMPMPSQPRRAPQDFDPNAFSLSFEEFGDLDASTLMGEPGLNFERDFAAWFDPENAK